MIRKLWLLCLNDLAIYYRNKTIFLVCFVPLFVFFVLTVVDNPDAKLVKTKLGLLDNEAYPQAMVEALPAAEPLISVHYFDSESKAKEALFTRSVDGLLMADLNSKNSTTLVVMKRDAVSTLALLQGLTQLQDEVEGRRANQWISKISPLMKAKGIGGDTISIWILMVILLVGFMILPPQIAEEKEKRLILGLLQSPIREWEWLAAKILVGMLLCITPAILLHSATKVGAEDGMGYSILLLVGSFCFSSVGALLGLLCKTQGSARAFGVVLYLPHLLPSALSDYSKTLESAASFVPSYHFYYPIKAMVLEDAHASAFIGNAFILLVIGCLACFVSSLSLKKRWLM